MVLSCKPLVIGSQDHGLEFLLCTLLMVYSLNHTQELEVCKLVVSYSQVDIYFHCFHLIKIRENIK